MKTHFFLSLSSFKRYTAASRSSWTLVCICCGLWYVHRRARSSTLHPGVLLSSSRGGSLSFRPNMSCQSFQRPLRKHKEGAWKRLPASTSHQSCSATAFLYLMAILWCQQRSETCTQKHHNVTKNSTKHFHAVYNEGVFIGRWVWRISIHAKCENIVIK